MQDIQIDSDLTYTIVEQGVGWFCRHLFRDAEQAQAFARAYPRRTLLMSQGAGREYPVEDHRKELMIANC